MKILKFYADYCSPCRTLTTMLAPFNFPITAVNIKLDPEMTLKYNVRRVPTLVFVNEEGVELARETGLVSGNEVNKIIYGLQRDSKDKQTT